MAGSDGASEYTRHRLTVTDRLIALRSALSPTPPFPAHRPRLRLSVPLVPLVLVTYFVKTAVFARLFTFVLGFAFFGQPLLVKAAHWLSYNVPNWREYLELRRCVVNLKYRNAQKPMIVLLQNTSDRRPDECAADSSAVAYWRGTESTPSPSAYLTRCTHRS